MSTPFLCNQGNITRPSSAHVFKGIMQTAEIYISVAVQFRFSSVEVHKRKVLLGMRQQTKGEDITEKHVTELL